LLDKGKFTCGIFIDFKINIDLKLLVHWLNANKIALDVPKTEMVLFQHSKEKFEYNLTINLDK